MDELPRRGMGIWNYLLITLVLLVIYAGQKMMGVEIVSRTMEKSLEKQGFTPVESSLMIAASRCKLGDRVEILLNELAKDTLEPAQAVVNKRLLHIVEDMVLDAKQRNQWIGYYDRRKDIMLGDIKIEKSTITTREDRRALRKARQN